MSTLESSAKAEARTGSALDAWLAKRARGAPPRVALGTMNFGKRTSEAEARKIIDEALTAGVKLFDTANVYNDGVSERIVGSALRSCRKDCIIATKGGLQRLQGKPEGLSREAILRAAQGSLERLKTDAIDVYYLHAPDHQTPIEETLDALADLHGTGLIRAWGVSNYSAWQILEMRKLAEARRMPEPRISQVIYNLLIREIEIEYFAFTKKFPIHTTIYNPLAGGLLSGRYASDAIIESGSRFDKNRMYLGRYWSKGMFEMVDKLRPIAEKYAPNLVEFSYRWVATKGNVDSILVGPATVQHLTSALNAIATTLPSDAIAEVDAAYREHAGTDTHYVR